MSDVRSSNHIMIGGGVVARLIERVDPNRFERRCDIGRTGRSETTPEDRQERFLALLEPALKHLRNNLAHRVFAGQLGRTRRGRALGHPVAGDRLHHACRDDVVDRSGEARRSLAPVPSPVFLLQTDPRVSVASSVWLGNFFIFYPSSFTSRLFPFQRHA
jgi:hypothetical protein